MAVVINGQIYENLVQIVAESGALNDDFIQGNSQVISFKLDAKFSSTLTSFRCFPNLATLIIMKTDGVVTLNPNIFDGTSVSRIIVPNSLLSAYQTAYPAWASLFDTWQFQIEFTIEHIAGESTTLTKQYIDDVVAISGGSAYATIVSKLIIDADFTDIEEEALEEIEELFPNLNVFQWNITGDFIPTDNSVARRFLSSVSTEKVSLLNVVFRVGYPSIALKNSVKSIELGEVYRTYSAGGQPSIFSSDYLEEIHIENFNANYNINFLQIGSSLEKIHIGHFGSNYSVAWNPWGFLKHIAPTVSFMVDELDVNLDLTAHEGTPDLTRDSIVYTLDHAITTQNQLTFTIGSANVAKIQAATGGQAAIDAFTAKGWTLQ